MVRTQIQLSEDDYQQLRAIASRQGRSMADCIREGIGLFLQRVQPRDFSKVPVFHSQPLDDLKDHDRWFVDTLLES